MINETNKFFQEVANATPQLALYLSERINGERTPETRMFYKDLLRVDQSLDGRWSTITASYRNIAADIVATGNALPLKRRESYGQAGGIIPKIGLKISKDEQYIQDMNSFMNSAKSQPEIDRIVGKLTDDLTSVIKAPQNTLEYMFLRGMSTGLALVSNDEMSNNNVDIQVDYGYLEENKFGVSDIWGSGTSNPLDDILRVLEKAKDDGNVIRYIYADPKSIKYILNSPQIRDFVLLKNTGVLVANSQVNVPIPLLTQLNSVFQNEYGFQLVEVNKRIKFERDGKDTLLTPWEEGMLIFTSEAEIGSLVWSPVAKMTTPLIQVTRQIVDTHILVSEWGEPDPLQMFIASETRAVPIISNVDKIYQLNSKIVEA